jgi:hypothetical protein
LEAFYCGKYENARRVRSSVPMLTRMNDLVIMDAKTGSDGRTSEQSVKAAAGG